MREGGWSILCTHSEIGKSKKIFILKRGIKQGNREREGRGNKMGAGLEFQLITASGLRPIGWKERSGRVRQLIREKGLLEPGPDS